MKYLYFTDPHLRSTNPRSRLGNYSEDILNKIAYCVQVSKEENCDAVICGGDLFHKPVIGIEEFLKLIDLLDGVNFICVRGNHDTYGNSGDTLDRSFLGLLSKLSDNSKIGIDRVDNIELYNYKDGGDINFRLRKTTEKTIHVVHQYVSDKLLTFEHTLIQNVPITEGDLQIVLCGHYHFGWKGAITHGNQVWINPGALCRQTLDSGDLQRQPECVILELDKPSWSFLPIPHRPIEDCFDLKLLKHQKEDTRLLVDLGDSLSVFDRENHIFSLVDFVNSDKAKSLASQKAIEELRKRLCRS